MRTVRYDKVLEGFNDTLAFCRSLGIGVDDTRLDVCRERIARLVEEIKTEIVSPTAPHLAGGLSDLEYFFPLTEAAEFADLLPFFQAVDPSQYRQKVELILRGPVLPVQEDSSSNQARNTLFELSIASRFWRAGFNPDLRGRADLTCDVNGRRLLFECKRPYSGDNVRRRISEAGRQLRKKLADAPAGARGVVAISLSRVMNPGDKLFVAANEQSLRRGLERHVRQAGEAVRSTWEKFNGTKVIAILFHGITPALDQAGTRYVVAQHTAGFLLARPDTPDDRTLQTLVSALGTTHY